MKNFIMQSLIIKILELGLAEHVRTGCIVVSFFISAAFCIWYGKKIGVRPIKTAIAVTLAFIITFILTELIVIGITFIVKMGWFGINSVLNSIARTFVFGAVIGLFVSFLLKVKWGKICDIFAFNQLIICAISSIGCIFPGCCVGYPCEWGLYSKRFDQNMFPLQPVNALIMLLIAAYLFVRSKKRGFVSDGKQYPIMLILFGSTRFITEFFMYSQRIFLGCTEIGLNALFTCIVGIIALIIIDRKEKVTSKTESN